MSMFCYQCQETAKGIGCTIKGVCGKSEDVSNLLDLLIYVSKGISICCENAEIEDAEVNNFVVDALFTSITNVNFDKYVIAKKIKKGRNNRCSFYGK